MKKILVWAAITVFINTTAFGQCTSLFSFAAYFNTITFLNQSTVSNAHYFWNFGDGTGSNFQNPIHTFPDNGDYLVTLFANDTVNNCSSYYEYWVNVTKYSSNPCQPSISDSITGDELYIFDNSTNCNGDHVNISAANFANFQSPTIDNLSGWSGAHIHIVCIGVYYDSVWNLEREAYKTAYYYYSSSYNYGDSSANFEFTVMSQDSSGKRIFFKAMNKSAIYYEWIITGFGNPIYSNYDTISQFYPYSPSLSWLVGLIIQGSGGYHDTIWQNIVVEDSSKTITGINEVQNQTFTYKLFPNPFTQQTVLQFPNLNQNAIFKLYNANGQLVRTINNVTGSQLIIDKENLSVGVYYFILRTEEKIIAAGKLETE